MLRELRTADLSGLKQLIHTTIRISYSDVYPEEAIQFFIGHHSDENIRKRTGSGYTIVIESHGEIIGTGTLLGNEIMGVFVQPEHQGKGYGRLIMRHLEDKALDLGIPFVKLDSSLNSEDFYESLGYTLLKGASIKVENNKKLDYYQMEKYLSTGEE